MALDKNVEKAILVDGSALDPTVGTKNLALYKPNGGVVIPLAKYESPSIPGPFNTSGTYEIEHNLATMFPLVWVNHSDFGIWQPSIEIVDENTVRIVENVDVAAGQSAVFVVLG